MPYAELHALSNFSFQRAASSARELCERAAKLGYQALAITDECSLAGIVRAHEAAKECGLPLIVGSEFHLHDGPAIVLLARDHCGYQLLCSLITSARRAAKKGRYRVGRQEVAGLLGQGLIAGFESRAEGRGLRAEEEQQSSEPAWPPCRGSSAKPAQSHDHETINGFSPQPSALHSTTTSTLSGCRMKISALTT